MRVAVIGAGIGGLTVAAGLGADGHEVVVYERREDPSAVGAGLTLFGNAFGALDAIGLGETVRNVSSDAIARMRAGQRTPSGDWLVSMPSAMVPTLRSLHRAELLHALVEALPTESLRLGQSATVASSGEPVVTVDGAEERFDLVIAADGLRSDARALLGLDRGVRYAGYTAWRGVTASGLDVGGEAGETWGAGASSGSCRCRMSGSTGSPPSPRPQANERRTNATRCASGSATGTRRSSRASRRHRRARCSVTTSTTLPAFHPRSSRPRRCYSATRPTA